MIGILFDLDGTLLDTLLDLQDAVNYALRHHSYPERSREEIRAAVGNGAAQLIRRSLPRGTEEAAAQQVLTTFMDWYGANCQVKTKPYEGILQALSDLRQCFPVAIVSNKLDMAVKSLCEIYFPGIYALGETPDCPRKPAPDMIIRGMAELGVDSCVYVGDSEVDVRTAENAGVPCVCVLWGFRDREELENAGGVHFCQSPQRLKETIEELIYGK